MLLILLIISLLTSQVSADRTLKTNSDSVAVTIMIHEAYYADLENDGIENDIFVSVELSFSGSNSYNFDYLIYLTLPSGHVFNYYISLSSRVQTLNMGNYFWNHALESGWYHVEASVILRTGGIALTSSDLVFDPPGGSGGSDPISFNLVIS